MTYIWSAMIIISFISAGITGRMDETVNAMIGGTQTAVSTLISFAGAMCFWTGIMKIAENSGIADFLCRLISPVVKRLFPSAGEKARYYISMNLTADLLGMGNASTPMGMLASEELDRENKMPSRPSDDMCMLVVLNTTCFQLIPSTIIALRGAAGTNDPASIILPIWFASAVSVAVGVAAVKAMCFLSGRRARGGV